ncbi:MAG: hypothetical protein ACTSUX_03025, partial [Promethearchaeota archaeon]
ITSQNYVLYTSKDLGKTFNKLTDIKVSPIHKFLSNSRLLSRALRLGVRALLKLKNGDILIIANGKIFLFNKKKIQIIYSFERGIGPLRNGLCEDERGNIYVGEFFK